MSITPEELKKIAKLSRIKVNQDEVEFFNKEVNNILQWIEKLQEVDVEGVMPMTSTENSSLDLREDEVTDGNITEAILKNGQSKYGCFVVPKVVE